MVLWINSNEGGITLQPSDHSHLITTHLANASFSNAISTLHSLESSSIYVPESTYLSLLTPLLHSPVPAHRATGFDLFAHMRLVAHPTPSSESYIALIEACGKVDDPQPERALDLWKEMTEDQGIQPDVVAFNAILRALSSVGRFWGEALRVFKTMLDFYKASVPAGGIPGRENESESEQRRLYTPNRETFEVLLRGAAKNGDLARTRWVLTEMIRFSQSPTGGEEVCPRSETLELVLMAYATARPVLSRGMVRFQKRGVNNQKEEEGEGEEVVVKVENDGRKEFKETFGDDETVLSTSTSPQTKPRTNVASTNLPQTSQEIMHEAQVLFAHAYNDPLIHQTQPDWRTPSNHLPPLRHVRMTPKLVNAYLSVVNLHGSSLSHALDRFRHAFQEAGVKKNGWSFRDILRRLERARPNERQRAAEEAFEVFKEWEAFEKEVERSCAVVERRDGKVLARDLRMSLGMTERIVESVWGDMIKIMT